ncbi:MAG: hypothetical protein H8E25_07740 [Planctomycetes bacterium]|nr:hypothetical protein [Planctomycetota bacterium]
MINKFSKRDLQILCGTYADELVSQLAERLHKAAVWVGLLEDGSGLYRPDHTLVPSSPLNLWIEIEELRVLLSELSSQLLDDAYYSDNIQQLGGNELCDLATMLIGDDPQLAITSASSNLINSRPSDAVARLQEVLKTNLLDRHHWRIVRHLSLAQWAAGDTISAGLTLSEHWPQIYKSMGLFESSVIMRDAWPQISLEILQIDSRFRQIEDTMNLPINTPNTNLLSI